MHEVEWGWDFTLQMDLWKARQHKFMSDVTLVYMGERYPAHRLLISIRSLPLAQLLEREVQARKGHEIVVSVDAILSDGNITRLEGDMKAAFNAVLEFISTDWLVELPPVETMIICEMSKILQMPFLFSLASARLLQLVRDEHAWWPLVVTTLWVPDDTDFAKMLLDHSEPEAPLPLPFDKCIAFGKSTPASILKSPYLTSLRIEALCALLADDFPDCDLSPEHLEHLLLQGVLHWIQAHPQHIQVLTLIKIPLLPAGALAAELRHTSLAVAPELIEEGSKAPSPPLDPSLISASGGIAQQPGSVLWRLVRRNTKFNEEKREEHPLHHPQHQHQQHPHQHQHQLHHHHLQPQQHLQHPQYQPQQLQQNPHPYPVQNQSQNHSYQEREGRQHVPLAKEKKKGRVSSRSGRDSVSGDTAVPDTVLQNDGKPPARFHQYRHLASNPSNLSTVLWETSLRPTPLNPNSSSSSSSFLTTNMRPSGSKKWRNPNALS
eukprot:TRINITY_DN27534_c0_g1_i1.p1 TRINITY_DN27534_c0_g1~~TRINITY_DN27534_c0_g1_i1.p1  ORF type:complete len:491 (+),score=119.65 TRINITY_DN27534_c0_g1_i1:45-1517(+)